MCARAFVCVFSVCACVPAYVKNYCGYVQLYVCLCVCVHVCMCARKIIVCVCKRACVRVRVCACVRAYVCLCIVCVCVCARALVCVFSVCACQHCLMLRRPILTGNVGSHSVTAVNLLRRPTVCKLTEKGGRSLAEVGPIDSQSDRTVLQTDLRAVIIMIYLIY